MAITSSGLQNVPAELLYEIQLFALSDSFPFTSRHFYHVFKNVSRVFRAKYILGRIKLIKKTWPPNTSDVYTTALIYPMCNQQVMEVLHTLMLDFPSDKAAVQLPRRLFRSLVCPESGWSIEDEPLPLLRYLYENPNIPAVNTNSHSGYALTKSVQAGFIPLIRYLLDNNASPTCTSALAVRVAIRQKNLDIVKMLVERQDAVAKKGRRRKLQDRIVPNSEMLLDAVEADATDIVHYLHREKKVVPDMQTLRKMTS